MGTSKINNLVKHKRIIIIGLVFIGFIVMIFSMYILTYVNNKPVIFGSKDNKISKKCEYFDFNILTSSITYKSGSSTGSIKCKGVISNLDTDITNVSAQFELHTNWTKDTDYTSSTTYSFNSGNKLKEDTTTQYLTDKEVSLQLNCDYPKKVLPFVKVKQPTIYVKLTYTRLKPTTLSEADRTETIYLKIPFSEYCSSSTIIK